jgi:Glycosyl hydrolases family 39
MQKNRFRKCRFLGLNLIIAVLGSLVFPANFQLSTTQAYPNTATITVTPATTFGAIPHYEQYNNQASVEPLKGAGDDSLLKGLQSSQIRTFVFTNDTFSPQEGTYNYSNHYTVLDDIVGSGFIPFLSITKTPVWLADTSYSDPVGTYRSADPPNNLTKYRQMLQNVIGHYKNRYPQIVYVQIWNEPNHPRPGELIQPISAQTYNTMYQAGVEAINTVNAGLGAGVVKLKVGGPVTTGYDLAYKQALIDYCAANSTKLDFISWQVYGTNPGAYKGQVEAIDSYLTQKGFSNVETIPTEWGWVGGGTTPNPLTAALLAKTATFAAVGSYWWLRGGADKSFFYVERHPTNDVKSQLAPVDGGAYPYYNVLKMMKMLKSTRVSATTNAAATDNTAIGVNALASSDSTGLAVLVWNWQNNNSTGYDTTVNINSFPAIFNGKTIQYERYLIDATHSNYLHDATKDKLERVVASDLTPRTSWSGTIEMAPNSVSLLVFTPLNGTRLNFEAETLPYTTSAGDTRTLHNDATASNGQWAKFNASGVNDYIAFTLNLPSSGTYNVRVGIKIHSARGIAQLAIVGNNQATPQDFYATTEKFVELDLGNKNFSAGGNKEFRFSLTGKNANSTGYALGFDYIKLTPL